jgi:hypothetical protein
MDRESRMKCYSKEEEGTEEKRKQKNYRRGTCDRRRARRMTKEEYACYCIETSFLFKFGRAVISQLV